MQASRDEDAGRAPRRGRLGWWRGRWGRLRQRHGWLDHLVRAGARYAASHGDHYAAAIAYFSVLALFPLLMIAFSIAGFVLRRRPDLVEELTARVTDAVPAGVGDAFATVVERAVEQRTTVGVLGLAIAAYSGLGWMSHVREALTAQWGQAVLPRRSIARTKAGDAVALAALGLALVVSLGLTAAGTGFTAEMLRLLGLDRSGWSQALLVAVTVLLAVAGNWLVLALVIARLPRQPVTLRSAARAAAFGAVGFEVLKQAVTLFLASLSGPAGAIFGSVIGLLFFVYLASRFLLFVTAWAATAAENERLLPARAGRPASGAAASGAAASGAAGAGATGAGVPGSAGRSVPPQPAPPQPRGQ